MLTNTSFSFILIWKCNASNLLSDLLSWTISFYLSFSIIHLSHCFVCFVVSSSFSVATIFQTLMNSLDIMHDSVFLIMYYSLATYRIVSFLASHVYLYTVCLCLNRRFACDFPHLQCTKIPPHLVGLAVSLHIQITTTTKEPSTHTYLLSAWKSSNTIFIWL